MAARTPAEIRYAQSTATADLPEWWAAYVRVDHVLGALALGVMAFTGLGLGVARAWEPPVLDPASRGFSSLRGMVPLAAILELVGLALKLPEMRPYVLGVVPVASILAAAGLLLLRKVLHRRRHNRACLHKVLAGGVEEAVATLVCGPDVTYSRWTITSACNWLAASTDGGRTIPDVPGVGELNAVSEVASHGGYRVISVVQETPGWSPQRLHHLACDLERIDTELAVDPGLMEIASPDLQVAVVDGPPLLRLTATTFTGAPGALKLVIDSPRAALLLLVSTPVMTILTIAVPSDGDPVFYRQSRVGKAGNLFPIIKFRSIVVNADQLQCELAGSNQRASPLVKLREDARVLHAARSLPKYSFDKLAQLFRVLSQRMSLVAPRPPPPEEIARCFREAERKLLVTPRLKGL